MRGASPAGVRPASPSISCVLEVSREPKVRKITNLELFKMSLPTYKKQKTPQFVVERPFAVVGLLGLSIASSLPDTTNIIKTLSKMI